MLDISPRRAAPWSSREDRVAAYSGFRPEVQGLRAVAVVLVVLYHVFMGRVSGGVDVFLAISAFFMTLSFVRKIEGGRSLALGRYWLHTFKRLLPLATIVILATFVLLALFFPATDVAEYRGQGVASILYTENWALAAGSVDYYAADHSRASPFQHFWSLSVQGQVFVLWPLLFWVVSWICSHRLGGIRWRPVPLLAVVFGLVFVASLTFSVITTHTQQSFAYFDTRARLWEFALGSLLALAIPYLRVSRAGSVLLGWVGIVGMVSVGVIVDVQGAFPGWIALWPLLSAAAIIVAGRSGSAWGFDRFLTWEPVVKLGDAAYALYLVHWPLLITYLVLRERPEAGPISGVVLVAASILLALALTRWVEQPLKRWRWSEVTPWRAAAVIAVCLSLVIVPARWWGAHMERTAAQLAEDADRNNPGAAVLVPGFSSQADDGAPTLPLPEELSDADAKLGDSCDEAYPGLPDAVRGRCTVEVDPDEPTRTVLVAGNSHMMHWLPAIRAMAMVNDWRLVTYTKLGCFYTTPEEQPEPYDCEDWLNGSETLVETVNPELVFVQGTFTNTNGEYWKPGLETRVAQLVERGSKVVGVRDVPRFTSPPAECAIDHGATTNADTVPDECVQHHAMLGTPDPQNGFAEIQEGFAAVDMTDVICPEGACPPVIGNVFVYWDDDHLSELYSETTAPVFTERAAEALERLGVQDVQTY